MVVMRYLLLLSVCAVGCMQAQGKSMSGFRSSFDKLPVPVKPTPTPPAPNDGPQQLKVPSNVIETIHQFAGDVNKIDVEKPIHIVSGTTKVDVPAGASFSYTMSDSGGTITFNDPKPIVTVREWGIDFHPTLQSVILTPPDNGQATVNEFGRPINKKFTIKWEDAPSGAESRFDDLLKGKPKIELTPIPEAESKIDEFVLIPFASPYYEQINGVTTTTSKAHLVWHGCPGWVADLYRGMPDVINQIHGGYHAVADGRPYTSKRVFLKWREGCPDCDKPTATAAPTKTSAKVSTIRQMPVAQDCANGNCANPMRRGRRR